MTVQLYGLDNCDTCRKARNWLTRFNIPHQFTDYRAHRLDAATLKTWATQLGGWDRLINRASTTWRNLPSNRKAPGSDPEWQLLLKEYPQLMKRPVTVTDDGVVSVGFNDTTYTQRFGITK
ncbi:Spx/MgsR family RNA polymerase-binding regulatory protein [Xanthomonadaceae bacterium JHOS43]|nr:Spx/MgsR family RNA polymerase-binding regulatory protein [Xanthomonadaceae bacterium JHOS43]MCX7564365.1 Spx/MgsR family RNA polymerase-binding regulatory protein [Xanthomonadaceae bacterium XH05]